MQSSSSSFLCNSSVLYSPAATTLSSRICFSLSFRCTIRRALKTSSSITQFRSNCLRDRKFTVSPLYSTATEDIVETSTSRSEFVEIGYIHDVHGLQGEVSITCNTDFPELRFSQGTRWLRQKFPGKDDVQEVEIVEGRGHPGQKRWIVKFAGVDDVDQAKMLVGATLLVKETDRPELEQGEFYSRDLIGMKVILKETGQPVGTIFNVYNHGAGDLLHVMLYSSSNFPHGSSKLDSSGPLVYVPFVEAIVPEVDMNRREMHITPPKGLLQLNIRSDDKSKKERRVLEWRERKKFQRRLIAAKKKLCEMEQQHVFDGFRFGEKSQASLLGEQIVSVNSKLLQQALQSIDRCDSPPSTSILPSWPMARSLKISEERFLTPKGGKPDEYSDLQDSGLDLIAQGKVATVLVLQEENQGATTHSDPVDPETVDISCISHVKTLLESGGRFIEDRVSLPLITISPASKVQHVERLFATSEYFGFDSEKVWFLKEEQLPAVSHSSNEKNVHKILMKSPWEILQFPIGSGGILTALSSNDFLEHLIGMGVEYIELCSVSSRSFAGNPVLLGFADSCKADVGFRTFMENLEDDFHMILSVNFVKNIVDKVDKFQFQAIPKANSYVEKVSKEWVDVVPSSANSYEFRCSIHDVLKACSSDQVCLVEFAG